MINKQRLIVIILYFTIQCCLYSTASESSSVEINDDATTTTTISEILLPVHTNHTTDDTSQNESNDTDTVLETMKETLSSSEELNATSSTTSSIAQQESTNETIGSDDTTVPIQKGPLIDILGQQVLYLEMLNESNAALRNMLTSDAIRNKKVIGLYFSADWCGPCRQFTPELVNFYNKMNQRRGKKNEFEIIWISRCRDVNAFGQYFTQMGSWYALPPEEAMGERGAMLSDKYKVKGIPTLVLLDDLGHVITVDGRNKIPQDKAGIGFPWRNPIATLYMTVVPRTIRYMIRSHIESMTEQYFAKVKQLINFGKKAK